MPISPTGSLGHLGFTVLSQGLSQTIFHQYKNGAYSLPDDILPHVLTLKEYWQRESPELQDGPSIVHLETAVCSKGKTTLTYRPARYFDFVHSNYSLGVPLSNGSTIGHMLAEGRFGALKSSPINLNKNERGTVYDFPVLGNSVGITINVMTKDGYMIVARRSLTAKGLACDKGNLLCAVGTQIKRHDPKYLDPASGVPTPRLSAQAGLESEMGEVIARTCSPLVSIGLVYRHDFEHCEIVYQTTSTLPLGAFLRKWKETKVPDRREFADVFGIRVTSPNDLLNNLADAKNVWSPQHAAGALLSLARHFPNEVHEAGLDI